MYEDSPKSRKRHKKRHGSSLEDSDDSHASSSSHKKDSSSSSTHHVLKRGGDRKLEERFMCPNCRKTLTNAVQCICLRKCGHVVCSTCLKDFVAKV